MTIKQAALIILFGALIELGSGECQDNGVKCLSANTFVFCQNNVADGKVFKCPDGDVCTTHKGICRPNCGEDPSSPVVPTKCGVCEASVNKLFACIGESTFIFCYGKDVPFEGSEGQCKEGYVCDVKNPQVCSPAGEVEPSCITDFSGLPTIPSDNSNQCPGVYTPPPPTGTTDTTEPETTDITELESTLPTVKNDDSIGQDLIKVCANNPDSEQVDLPGCRSYVKCSEGETPIKETCFPNFYNKDTTSCQRETPESCRGLYNHLCKNVTPGSYVYIEGSGCKEYVSCNNAGDELEAVQTQCSKTYFHKDIGRCLEEKPESC